MAVKAAKATTDNIKKSANHFPSIVCRYDYNELVSLIYQIKPKTKSRKKMKIDMLRSIS